MPQTTKRYIVTVDSDDYTHHVIDTEAESRIVAICMAGTHEENREDAERIARLLNAEDDSISRDAERIAQPSKEARDAALVSPILYAAITRWQGGAPWVVEVEKAAVILAGQLDASHKYSAELLATRPSTAGADFTTYLAYEAGQRDAPGWRPVTETEPRHDPLDCAPVTNGQKWVAAHRWRGAWLNAATRKPLGWVPTHYLAIPPLPSEEPAEVDDLVRDCAAHQRRLQAWRQDVSLCLGLVPPEGTP